MSASPSSCQVQQKASKFSNSTEITKWGLTLKFTQFLHYPPLSVLYLTQTYSSRPSSDSPFPPESLPSVPNCSKSLSSKLHGTPFLPYGQVHYTLLPLCPSGNYLRTTILIHLCTWHQQFLLPPHTLSKNSHSHKKKKKKSAMFFNHSFKIKGNIHN